MRYVVKCAANPIHGAVQVVATDASHAVEAAGIMMAQGFLGIIVEDVQGGSGTPIADFLIAHGAPTAA